MPRRPLPRREVLKDYSKLGGGAAGVVAFDSPHEFLTGIRKVDGHRAIRTVCSVILDGPVNEFVSRKISSGCEREILEWIRKLGQSTTASPFRVAGANEVEWTSSL